MSSQDFSSNRTRLDCQADKSLRTLSNDNATLRAYRREHVLTELFLNKNRDSLQSRNTFPQLVQGTEDMLKALPLAEQEIVVMRNALPRAGQAM